MHSPILIHVGFPKTASTWLQQTLFNNAEAGFESPLSVLQIKEAFFMVNEYMFSPVQTRNHFAGAIKAVLDRGKVPVISDEWFSGNQVTAESFGIRLRNMRYLEKLAHWSGNFDISGA